MSELAFSAPGYRLELSPDGLRATLTAADGTFLAALRPLAALDTVAAPDETVEVLPPVVADVPGGRSFTVARRSTIWDEARVVLTCTETAIEVRTSVAGTGALADAHLLAGRASRAAVTGSSHRRRSTSPSAQRRTPTRTRPGAGSTSAWWRRSAS